MSESEKVLSNNEADRTLSHSSLYWSTCPAFLTVNKTAVPVFYHRIKYRYMFGCVWIKPKYIDVEQCA